MTTDHHDPHRSEREARRAHTSHSHAAKRRRSPTFPPTCPSGRSGTSAVIGAGTMGGGIAMSLASIGIPSTLIDADAGGLDAGSRPHAHQL